MKNGITEDYYTRLLELSCDFSIDDFIKMAVGYVESQNGINSVNQLVSELAPGREARFDETFSRCLAANGRLHFNAGFIAGLMAGVYRSIQAAGPDIFSDDILKKLKMFYS